MTNCYRLLLLIVILIKSLEAQHQQNEALQYENSVKIIRGKEAAPHSFPFQVALYVNIVGQDEKVFCGGSIISEYFILSAAHCVDRAITAEVILGAHNVHKKESTQQRFTTRVFIINRDWNSGNLKNDIAIIKLPSMIVFTKEIQPVTLPKLSDEDKSFIFSQATLIGWGKTSDNAQNISSVLLYAQSKVTSQLICKLMFFGNVGKTQLCTSGNKGISTCAGDSGGPLIIYEKTGTPVQQGIVSFGIGFGCEKGWPQVYTRVSKYLRWIFEHTGIPVRD